MLRAADSTRLMAGGLYRTIVENAVDAIVVIDRYGSILWVNGATAKTFGYDEAELIGRNVSLLMPAPYRAQHDGDLERYLNTGEPRIIGIRRELLGLRKDGTTFPIELTVVEAADHEGLIFVGAIRDITSRKRLKNGFDG
jgi:PAS domain S-box-containing protein